MRIKGFDFMGRSKPKRGVGFAVGGHKWTSKLDTTLPQALATLPDLPSLPEFAPSGDTNA